MLDLDHQQQTHGIVAIEQIILQVLQDEIYRFTEDSDPKILKQLLIICI